MCIRDRFNGNEEHKVWIDVQVDSDWAGNEDRKSTSGGIILIGGVGVKHWSRTQKTRALSVGEAEYYAVVTGSAEGLGVQSLGKDMGYEFEVQVWTDCDAGRSMANRRGLGKARHMELRFLWVQEKVKDRALVVRRIDGDQNVADHLTKGKHREDMKLKLSTVGGNLVLK